MFILYEVLLYLVLLLALPFFLLTGGFRGKYLVNLPQRVGRYPHPAREHDLWIHAVSVGEVLAAGPVVAAILRLRPATSIVVTTTTLTGQAQARRLYPAATVTYFPFDLAFAVRRFLAHHRPRVFAAMETEIWPNVTRIAGAEGVRLILTNGRISDRSFPRYRRVRRLLAPLLRNYEKILVRDQTDGERFIAIGAPPEIVEISGNVKFDFVADEAPLHDEAELLRMIAGRPVLVLGSTTEGEDELLLPEIEHLASTSPLFIVIAPRKPERFDVVATLLAGTSLRVVRRSTFSGGDPQADVLLLDTFGELAKIYRYATAAFIGGTLVPVGGHNPIEPAAAGVPVCFGPSMTNFREIAEIFLRSGAAVEVADAADVAAFSARMIADRAMQKQIGERARETVVRNRGASERSAARIVEMLQ